MLPFLMSMATMGGSGGVGGDGGGDTAVPAAAAAAATAAAASVAGDDAALGAELSALVSDLQGVLSSPGVLQQLFAIGSTAAARAAFARLRAAAAAAPSDRAASTVLREVGSMYRRGELAALLGEAATRCPALLPLLPAVTRVLDALANSS